MTVVMLGLQFVTFILWMLVSGSILIGLLRGPAEPVETNADDEILDPVTRFLNDPTTRGRRWAWVALTLALLLFSSLSSGLLVRL